MKLVTYRPFPDFMGLRSEIDRLFQQAMSERQNETEGTQVTWAPRVDIHEDENGIVFSADLPGVNKEEVKITFNDNVLSISGEKKIERDKKETNYHRIERYSGSYMRSFSLPPGADPTAIKASYKDGVLTITVPKKEEAKPKEIPINIE